MTYIALFTLLTVLIHDESATLMQAVVTNAVGIFLVPIPQISAVLMYYDLRSRKENLDVRPLFTI